jgi:hypothetical protein
VLDIEAMSHAALPSACVIKRITYYASYFRLVDSYSSHRPLANPRATATSRRLLFIMGVLRSAKRDLPSFNHARRRNHLGFDDHRYINILFLQTQNM